MIVSVCRTPRPWRAIRSFLAAAEEGSPRAKICDAVDRSWGWGSDLEKISQRITKPVHVCGEVGDVGFAGSGIGLRV